MVEFLEIQTEMVEEVVKFLTSETWPFHGQPNPKDKSIRDGFQKGNYTENDKRSFWIMENEERIGMIRIFDLDDPTCLFDLRLKKSHRGKGIGLVTLNWLTQFVFTQYPKIIRVEGHTRHDNYAMRKTFYKGGFVKEAYHRQGWPQEGRLFDSVGYATLRKDWEDNTVTPIEDTFAY
jgi:RimJ/RimL family protein N-acetyltransferase